MMIIIILLSNFYQLILPNFLFLLFQYAALYLWSNLLSSFPLQEVDLCKDLSQPCLFVICDLLLSSLEVLLQDLQGKIINLLISQMLNLLIHNSNNSSLLDADDVVDDDPLHCQQFL